MEKAEKKNVQKKKSGKIGISAFPIILLCFVLAVVIYEYVYGNPSNFINNDPNNHPVQGNLLGTIYKGGIIVPLIQTLLLTVLTLSVERFFALRKAKGKKDLQQFVVRVKGALDKGNLDEANALCDAQQGSVANVIKSSLKTYKEVSQNEQLAKEERQLAVRQDLEEATMLELPTMEQNLSVIATITTLGTLLGLLGTVIGMIRSFAALSSTGGTDSIALSTGISEALVNTAFGIATGACAVIAYNFFTTKIDGITHSIDEMGAYLVQTFAGKK
ncbi:MAG: MotA/TolQ/ExbB proton channel family protein [Odoribacteraceae bacterium]|jgi:biopolymer transport protein ExbB|nr:MotA/TolQ/ExbB proton channel family protein [Odoribacteraceae bacterium]